MVQGGFKITKPAKSAKPGGLAAKKAAKRIIAPKKGDAVTTAKLKHKHGGAIAVGTEKMLSARVGHLELLKGSRREIAKAEALAAAKKKISGGGKKGRK
ncbi:uncharacterized protein V1518DRAFT_423700 [Limtongia smithiae]|uniref:uncharacterized protein n=1 Tax=Limtongia smithiae TaxID=1125753 RepID=UPI0034CEBA21